MRTNPPHSTLKPRWFRFGPGLLLAIIASVVVWQRQPLPRDAPARTVPDAAEYLKDLPQKGLPQKGLPQRQGRESPPLFDRALPAAPDPNWLLSQRKALALNTEQTRKLESLRARWQRDTRQLRAMLAHASEEFQRDMANEKERAVSLQVLQERAAPVAELSRQLAQARRAWWNEAAPVLSVEQRQRAEAEWGRRFLSKPATAEKSGDTK